MPKRKADALKPVDDAEIVGRCNALLRNKNGKRCRLTAGNRTDHVGKGRCWLHGGARGTGRPPTHGRGMRYSTDNMSPRLKGIMEELANDPDPMNLLPEVLLLRTVTRDVVERWDEFQEGLSILKAAADPAFQVFVRTVTADVEANKNNMEVIDVEEAQPIVHQLAVAVQNKPASMDITIFATLVEKIGALVERIHKMKTEKAMTPERVKGMLDGMGLIVMKYTNQETATKIMNAWLAMQV